MTATRKEMRGGGSRDTNEKRRLGREKEEGARHRWKTRKGAESGKEGRSADTKQGEMEV